MLRKHLSTQFIAAFAGVAILAIVVVTASVLWNLRQRTIAHVRDEARNLAQIIAEQTAQEFGTADSILRAVDDRLQSKFGAQFALNSPEVNLLLSSRISGMKQFASLSVVSQDGHVINSSRGYPAKGISVADRVYFTATRNNRDSSIFISKPERGRLDNRWTVHIARALLSAQEARKGVLVISMDLGYMETLFGSLRLDVDRPIAMYEIDGALVASYPHNDAMTAEQAYRLNAVNAIPLAGKPEIFTHVSGDGTRTAFALARVPQLPFLVGVDTAEEEALLEWRETAIPVIAMSTAGVLLMIMVGTLFILRLRRENELSDALDETLNRFQHTVGTVSEGILAVDNSGAIVMCNEAAERMLGLRGPTVLGQPLDAVAPLFNRQDTQGINALVAALKGDLTPERIELKGRDSQGQEFWAEATISRTAMNDRVQQTAVLHDITERKHTETDLKELNTQLRRLSESMIRVREDERHHLSRELHDELGQQLTGLKLDLTWVGHRARDGRPVPADKVEGMRRSLDSIIIFVSKIAASLRPTMLDDLGFQDAVSWLIKDFAKRSGIEMTIDLDAADHVLSPPVTRSLYRIVQESLTNIARHANASAAIVRLSIEGSTLRLAIIDNGVGFEARTARKEGLGLIGIRERALSMGGKAEIKANDGGGTIVMVSVPLAEAERSE